MIQNGEEKHYPNKAAHVAGTRRAHRKPASRGASGQPVDHALKRLERRRGATDDGGECRLVLVERAAAVVLIEDAETAHHEAVGHALGAPEVSHAVTDEQQLPPTRRRLLVEPTPVPRVGVVLVEAGDRRRWLDGAQVAARRLEE